VSFALKSSVLQEFLRSNGVEYDVAPRTGGVDAPALREVVKAGMVVVECWP
jgi:hypothetical protein